MKVQPNFPNASLFPAMYTLVYPSSDSNTLKFFVFFQGTQLSLTLGPLPLVFPLSGTFFHPIIWYQFDEKPFAHFSLRSHWEILGSDHLHPFNLPQAKKYKYIIINIYVL